MATTPPTPGSQASAPSSWPSSPPNPDFGAITARLQVLAREAKASRIPFHDGHSEHRRVLFRAVSNVLSTDLALFTFAQIIDGLPTADVAWDRRYSHLVGAHPIEEHADICPGVLDRARQFRADFDPYILSFSPQVRHTHRTYPCWLSVNLAIMCVLLTCDNLTDSPLIPEGVSRLSLVQYPTDRARCYGNARDWGPPFPAWIAYARR